MKVLEEMILTPSVSLSEILRKTFVFAYKTKNEKIKKWIENELNGYSLDIIEIPYYRIIHPDCYGTIINLVQKIENFPIPFCNIPENLKHHYNVFIFREAINVFEEHIKSDSFSFNMLWPPDYIAVYNSSVKMDLGYSLVQAWWLVPKTSFGELLERVRNTLLKFILELEEEYPSLTEENYNIVSKEKVEQTFINCIFNNGLIIGNGNEFSGETNIESQGD